MTHPVFFARSSRAALLAACCCSSALAQVTIKPDGQWRHLFGAGASYASGNSEASSFNLNYDGVRATDMDKWSLTGRALYSRDDTQTTGERFGLGTQYNRDLSPDWFAFGTGDALRDRPANLKLRASVASGIGYHVQRSDAGFFDVSAGLGYSQDRYQDATEIDGTERTRYGRFELLLAEETNHKLTDTAAFKQKLRLLPNLRDNGEYRADFESAITVAINSSINLTAGLAYRYDSDPGTDVQRSDTLVTTGVSLRFD